MECTRWRKNQQAYLEVIWKDNKTDDVICLHFGVYGNTCGHMIPSSVCTSLNSNFTGKRSGISVNPIIADGASEDYCSLWSIEERPWYELSQ